ncbi:response regulator transcription factor [Kribbella sp. NPDC056861]|uniref:response regulator transcription factor n=1 Tax=Kribbella sp. NPDC056861 TaxID=3154857 RepID=UPI00341E99A8
MTIRLLLVDDQPLIRAGFRMFLEPAADLEVVGEAGTGRQAIEFARATRADVVLMDIRMPDIDGIEATRRIAADDDLAGVRVLILTTFETDDNVVLALRAGASGFLVKNVEPVDLLHAVRVVAAGESLLSPAATQALINRFLTQAPLGQLPAALDLIVLTGREREILALVAYGLSNQQIAEQLFLSPLTVKTHINRAMTKLDVRDRAQLVVIAYQSGLAHPGGRPA